MEKEITVEVLKDLLKKRKMKQQDLCPILGLNASKISRIMTERRTLHEAEEKLLRLYFYGVPPFALMELDEGVLDLEEHEWKRAYHEAAKEGLSPREWLTQKVRCYLAMLPQIKGEKKIIAPLQTLEANEIRGAG